jgi:hypothetical protein
MPLFTISGRYRGNGKTEVGDQMPDARGRRPDLSGQKCESAGGGDAAVADMRFLIREELAAVLRISVRMVDEMVAHGEIPFLRIRAI